MRVLSDRVQGISESPTLRVSAMAADLRADGIDVLDLSAGQPDFETPAAVKQAGKNAIDENRTGYTVNVGIIELRRAICEQQRNESGLEFEPSQIIVSPGGKASLYFACQALLNPGDEVIVPSPYWVTYPEQVRLAQAEPVFVECAESDEFKLTAEAIDRGAAAVTE